MNNSSVLAFVRRPEMMHNHSIFHFAHSNFFLLDLNFLDEKQLLTEAIRLQEDQNLREALKTFRAVLRIYRRKHNLEHEAYVLDCMGEVLQGLHKEKRALAFHARAFALSAKCGDVEIQGSAAGNRGVVHYLLGELNEADHWLNQAVQLYKQLDDVKKVATHLGNLGLVYSSRNEYTQATRLLNKALTKFQKIGDQLEQAYTLQDLGYVARLNGKMKRSLSYAKRALRMHLSQENSVGATECYSLIGLIYFDLDQHHHAEEYLLTALETIEHLRAPLHRQHIFTNLAYVYLNLNRQHDAAEVLREALALFSEVAHSYERAKVLESYGLLQRELGDLDEAFQSLEESFEIRKALGMARDIEMSLYNLGMTYIQCDRLTESIRYLSDSIELCNAHGWERERACALTALGIVYDKQNEFELGQECYNTAIELFENVDDCEGLWAAYLNLGALYENGIDDVQGALQAYRQSIKYLMKVRRRMSIDYRIPYVEDKLQVFDQIISIYVSQKKSKMRSII